MLLMRAFVEVDVINPYVVGSFLLYYAAGLLAAPAGQRAASATISRSASPKRRTSSSVL
jgi:exopolysaccharide production protein ExoQ